MDFYVSDTHIKQLHAVDIWLVDDLEFVSRGPDGETLHPEKAKLHVQSYGQPDLELGLAQSIGLTLFEDHLGHKHLSHIQFHEVQRLHLDMVHLLDIAIQKADVKSIRQTQWMSTDDGTIIMSNSISQCTDADCDNIDMFFYTAIGFAKQFVTFINTLELQTGWWHKDEHNQWHHVADSAQAEDVNVFGELRAVLASNRVDKYRLKQLLDEQEQGLLDYAIDCLVQRANMPKPHLDGLLHFDPTKGSGRFDPT